MLGAGPLLLAAVFLAAALAKLRGASAFADAVRTIVPAPLAGPVTRGVPLVELALAGLLLSDAAPRAAAIAALAVLVLFSAALVALHVRSGGTAGCGCFGEGTGEARPGGGLVRNVLLVAIAAAVVVDPGAAGVWSGGGSEVAGRLMVVLGTVCLWSLVRAFALRGAEASA